MLLNSPPCGESRQLLLTDVHDGIPVLFQMLAFAALKFFGMDTHPLNMRAECLLECIESFVGQLLIAAPVSSTLRKGARRVHNTLPVVGSALITATLPFLEPIMPPMTLRAEHPPSISPARLPKQEALTRSRNRVKPPEPEPMIVAVRASNSRQRPRPKRRGAFSRFVRSYCGTNVGVSIGNEQTRGRRPP
jgi:hypothetical protein